MGWLALRYWRNATILRLRVCGSFFYVALAAAISRSQR